MLMSIFYTINIWRIRSMPVDIPQMLCSISCLNNNGQEYLFSGSVIYLVRCDRGLSQPHGTTSWQLRALVTWLHTACLLVGVLHPGNI